MSHICVSNASNRKELEIGKTYEIFSHENSKCVWVKIPSEDMSLTGTTIQCYSSDFKTIEDFRNDKINDILS